MKTPAVAVILALAGVPLVLAASCSVNRHSSEFACTTDDQCMDGRICDHGFCVEGEPPCPAGCDDCSFTSMTCQINCNAANPCGSVQCPAGFECSIRCTGPGACATVDCAQGTGCEISCNNAMACGPINCGPGDCLVDCSGSSSCQTVDCASSCGCDVKCNNPMACLSPSCPMGPTQCTRNNELGAPCDSSQQGCNVCQ
ncbi:MAG TPA: hypothetical protein VFK02_20645 [Kofleriaceae bacterium]|nr:hypothetical protein [Kofleriaceae bacterium]